MRALVVYESMFGSARELAEAIASGLAAGLDVRLIRSDELRPSDAGGADIVVAGGPAQAERPEPGEPEWFDELEPVPHLFAAFDSRTDLPQLFPGAASVRIGVGLRRRGSTPLVPPESFLVTEFAGLKPGEAERARSWGARIADAARRAGPHAASGAAS